MRRRKGNIKKQSQGFVFPVPLALFLILVTGASMAYLWMHARCEAAGKRIQALERNQAEVRQRLLNEDSKWSNLKSMRNVEAALKKYQLTMTLPSDRQVVRLSRAPSLSEITEPPYSEYAGYMGGGRE